MPRIGRNFGPAHGGHARALERPWTLQKLVLSAVDALSHAVDPQGEHCRLESPPCPPSVSAARLLCLALLGLIFFSPVARRLHFYTVGLCWHVAGKVRDISISDAQWKASAEFARVLLQKALLFGTRLPSRARDSVKAAGRGHSPLLESRGVDNLIGILSARCVRKTRTLTPHPRTCPPLSATC